MRRERGREGEREGGRERRGGGRKRRRGGRGGRGGKGRGEQGWRVRRGGKGRGREREGWRERRGGKVRGIGGEGWREGEGGRGEEESECVIFHTHTFICMQRVGEGDGLHHWHTFSHSLQDHTTNASYTFIPSHAAPTLSVSINSMQSLRASKTTLCRWKKATISSSFLPSRRYRSWSTCFNFVKA